MRGITVPWLVKLYQKVIAPATEAVFHPSWKYAGEQEVAGGAARQRWPDCGGALQDGRRWPDCGGALQDGVGVWRLGTWRRWPAAICRVGRRTWLDVGTAAALVSTKLPDLQFQRSAYSHDPVFRFRPVISPPKLRAPLFPFPLLPRRHQLDFFLSHPLLLFWFSSRNRERARRGVERSSGTDRLQAVYHTNSCARRDSREERGRPPVAFVTSIWIPGVMGMLSLNRLMLKQERRRRWRIQARSKPPLGPLDLSAIRLCLCSWPQLTYVTCYAYFWVHGPMGRASIAIPLYFFIKRLTFYGVCFVLVFT
jgi:hypothetical protein